MVRKCRGCKQVNISSDELLCEKCEERAFDSGTGIKYDHDKPDLSLLPKPALDGAARAFMYGAQKYGRDNYRGGMEWMRLTAASMRHITAFNEGENLDIESGLSHVHHALACLSMLALYIETGVGKDNRPIKEVVNESNKKRESSSDRCG